MHLSQLEPRLIKFRMHAYDIAHARAMVLLFRTGGTLDLLDLRERGQEMEM